MDMSSFGGFSDESQRSRLESKVMAYHLQVFIVLSILIMIQLVRLMMHQNNDTRLIWQGVFINEAHLQGIVSK